MRLSKIIFRILTSWFSIILGNLTILFLVLLAMYAASLTTTTAILPDLQSDTMTTIIISWGVLLESRDVLLNDGLATRQLAKNMERLLSNECTRCGTLLVCLGMFVELSTYFDVDTRMKFFPSWAESALLIGEWGMLVLICVETVLSCVNVARIKWQGEEIAAQRLQSVA